MPLRTQCPAGHKLIVPDDRAGRSLRCPRCDAAFTVQGSGFGVQEEASHEQQASAGKPTVALQQVVMAVAEPQVEVSKAKELPRMDKPVRPDAMAVKFKSPVKPTPPPAATCGSLAAPPAVLIVEPVSMPVEQVRSPEAPPIEAEIVLDPLVERPVEALIVNVVDVAPPPPIAPEPIPPVADTPVEANAEAIDAVVELAEVEPVAAPQAALPDRHWLPGVYSLAGATIAAALFGIAPAVWDVVEYLQYYDEAADPHVSRWALVLFLLGVVQAAYAIYLFQLPDWTSVWVVTIYSLALAGLYALGLGLVVISGDDGLFVGPHGLQLADKLASGKAGLWCVAMTCVSTIIAFFAGRLSAQWRRAESLLRGAVSQPAALGSL